MRDIESARVLAQSWLAAVRAIELGPWRFGRRW